MFRKKPQPQPTPRRRIEVPTDFPTGLAVVTDKGAFFIKGKSRFKFFSGRVYQSWKVQTVYATYAAIKHLTPAGTLGFRDGTLIHNVADGKMYLISGNKRRHITSPDVFDKYGLVKDSMIAASDDEVALHEEGEVLS